MFLYQYQILEEIHILKGEPCAGGCFLHLHMVTLHHTVPLRVFHTAHLTANFTGGRHSIDGIFINAEGFAVCRAGSFIADVVLTGKARIEPVNPRVIGIYFFGVILLYVILFHLHITVNAVICYSVSLSDAMEL